MNHNFQNRHRPRSRPPQSVTPTHTGKGLGSAVNYRYTLDILRASDRDQINQLLQEAGYGAGIRTGNLAAAVEADVRKFVQTEEGERMRSAAIERIFHQAAATELASGPGLQRLEQIKSQLVANTLIKDVDVFAGLCQAEIRRQVQAWLQSPAGLAAVDLAKQCAADREARPTRWQQKPLREETDL